MKRLHIILFIAFTAFYLSSCHSYRHGMESSAQRSNLTIGMVRANIEEGRTTQTEILELFGAPNLITRNRTNNEVWSYNRMATTRRAGSSSFFDGSRASASSSSTSFDLIIIFDENNIVLNYSVVSSAF